MSMILILGIDGYLGWALANHLASLGYDVSGVDAGYRRRMVEEVGGASAIPIMPMATRVEAFRERWGRSLQFYEGDIAVSPKTLERAILATRPQAIVHLAENPSAPYSMIDAAHAAGVQRNNVVGTLNLLFLMRNLCPDTHLVKLGTMGEYGTPNLDIPEGYFNIEYRGRTARLPFPKQAGSFYHLSKVHDTANIAFACKTWGLRATDVMQGVVYGTWIDAFCDDMRLATRLDFDECFGTVINRFCCQAVIGSPLTVYGLGEQTRGFLPLSHSMQCLELAIANPPEKGEHRVFNQFEWTYSVSNLANVVAEQGKVLGLNPEIAQIPNPRIEAAKHYYNPDRNGLLELGYEPISDLGEEIKSMLEDLMPHEDRIREHAKVLSPRIRWDGKHGP